MTILLTDKCGSRGSFYAMPQFYVYIMTNRARTTLYTGVTNDILRRVYEHKHNPSKGFTGRYRITDLVYYEETSDVYSAISKENQIKGWLRSRKIELVESVNPQWKDLSDGWYEDYKNS